VADLEQTFHRLVGGLDYPMFIVTACHGDERAGCLVGFTTQTSIDPPRFLVCLSEKNRTTELARDAEVLGVHCVPADAESLAELFGGETGHEVDKFAQVSWRTGTGGVPLLDDCPNRFVGRVESTLPAGDHLAVLLAPVQAQAAPGVEEFTFHRAKRIEPGHEA
jgi:flavin reductase (DIM6/NTAB) family NADH-FMN oxidoreductase RutF